jgi:DNA-binding SARP family transcriptional activator
MPGLEIFLFGKPRVERDGAAVTIARRKALALLAYLVVTRQAHSRDALIALLWPELDSEHGRAVLRSTLADLSQAIGKDGLAVAGDGVACQAPALRVDVARFHDLLAQVAGHNDPLGRPCHDCLTALTEAVKLYRADFLAGFTLEDAVEFDAWQTFQTESLRLELAAALEKLAHGWAGRQQWDAAISHARRWLALDPLHEPAQRLLMQLYVGAGDRAAAIRQYQECVNVLHEELGIEPEPETTALFEAIRGGAASLSSAPLLPGSPAPTHNLPPDPTPFIGRELELAQVATQLADPDCRLLTIFGPGGIGKTRLAIQAARDEAGRFAHGACFVDLAPIASAEMLAATILRTLQAPSSGAAESDQHVLSYLAGRQLLLVLDNYEHLLTGAEPDRCDGYGLVTKILGAAPQVKLLVTSRARLNVRAEWLETLEGMRVPGGGFCHCEEHPEQSQPPFG